MKTAQTTARTAREMFYFVDDVQRMLGYSRSKSYKIIKQLNDELVAQGWFIQCFPGSGGQPGGLR